LSSLLREDQIRLQVV